MYCFKKIIIMPKINLKVIKYSPEYEKKVNTELLTKIKSIQTYKTSSEQIEAITHIFIRLNELEDFYTYVFQEYNPYIVFFLEIQNKIELWKKEHEENKWGKIENTLLTRFMTEMNKTSQFINQIINEFTKYYGEIKTTRTKRYINYYNSDIIEHHYE